MSKRLPVELQQTTHRDREVSARRRKGEELARYLFKFGYQAKFLRRLRLHEWQLVAKLATQELGRRIEPPQSLETMDIVVSVVADMEAKMASPFPPDIRLEDWNGFPCLNISNIKVFPAWKPPSIYMNKLMRIWKLAVADVFHFCRKPHPLDVRYGFLYHEDPKIISGFRENCFLISGWVPSGIGSAGTQSWKKRFERFQLKRGEVTMRNKLHEAALVEVSNVLRETIDNW